MDQASAMQDLSTTITHHQNTL